MEQLSHSTPEISTAQRYRRMRRLRIEEENENKAIVQRSAKTDTELFSCIPFVVAATQTALL
jgi:hypothetical protein